MDPISVAGTAIGAISLGVQIAQILQTQIDQLLNADERLVQIVFEIRATAAGLANLQEVLDYEKKYSGHKSLRDGGQSDIKSIISRCNHIFRKVVVLIAKPGRKAALAQVDEFQRKIEQQAKGRRNEEPTLEIELSRIEHLVMWWRIPKLEKYRADLNSLTLTLLFLLTTDTLRRRRRRRRRISTWRNKMGLIKVYLWWTRVVGIRQIKTLEGSPPVAPLTPLEKDTGQAQGDARRLHVRFLGFGKN
ncbi:hypothetical protein MMC30_008089 [Trapelia coarctata]|nr:hypothetical protein [Trapelia coarctata]